MNLASERLSGLLSNTQPVNGKTRPGVSHRILSLVLSTETQETLRIAAAWPGFSEKALILNSFATYL